MKLLMKINLVLVVVFGIGICLIARGAYGFLMDAAKKQVIAEAELMRATSSAVFDYNEQQISPLLEKMTEQGGRFLPQAIPFYAVNKTFQYLRSSYPNYSVRETALNPINLDNRAADWEADLIQYFRDHPGQTERHGERDTVVGPMLYVAHAMVNDSSCLQCHGEPSAAPQAMVQYYGRDHGYQWKVNEVSGAQIVSVPMSVPIAMARREFRNLMVVLGAIFLLTIFLIDLAMYVVVIRPLRRVVKNADIISKGEIDLPQLAVRGRDEIAEVTASFNRMHTSLIKVFEMLNG